MREKRLLDEYFLLSYDVNALREVPRCFGSLDVAFDEHAVDCVDINNFVFSLNDFNVLDVVDYAVDCDGLVNRASEVLNLRYVDVSAAAGYRVTGIGSDVEHRVLEVQACLAIDCQSLESTYEAVVVNCRSIGYSWKSVMPDDLRQRISKETLAGNEYMKIDIYTVELLDSKLAQQNSGE